MENKSLGMIIREERKKKGLTHLNFRLICSDNASRKANYL